MAILKGVEQIHEVRVPKEWLNVNENSQMIINNSIVEPDFVKNIMRPMQAQRGQDLPVSEFKGKEDGTIPSGTTAYEKRGIAVNVPEWIEENCIQCNQCSYICPHAVIRPFLLTEEELNKAPISFETIKATGKSFEGLYYRMQISPMDCTGCGNCADICPAKENALVMKPIETQLSSEVDDWEFANCTVGYKTNIPLGATVKDSQFREPLIEFSGACAGCGETAYIKLITQLYGNRMMIANATGCSSIWGASAPSSAYSTNMEGKGPAWANSLFEDNAEFGFGMHLATKQMRNGLEETMKQLLSINVDVTVKELISDWLNYKEDGEISEQVSNKLIDAIENYEITDDEVMLLLNNIKQRKDYLIKRSQWIIGGDGWAYDIGFGGLDHIMASGEDINVLVFDTEVYSNTGGQASKFASAGKK